MDFSDIIFYIVLGAIGILSSIKPQKAKKTPTKAPQKPATSEDKPDKDKNIFETFFEEIEKKEEEDAFEPLFGNKEDIEKQESKPQQDAIPTLDDIFRALREKRPLQPTPAVKPKEVVAEPQPTPVVKQQIKADEVKPTMPDIASEEIQDSNFTYDYNNEIDLDNIDWRQAVITSEILQRKY